MKKPLILVSPVRANADYYGSFYTDAIVNMSYNMEYITEFGGISLVPDMVRTPEQAEELIGITDGLFVTGGDDVAPGLYGEEVLDCCGVYSDERDRSDVLLIEAALKAHKPILGICRGCQIGNVYFGGTLYQDIATQFSKKVLHRAYGSATGINHEEETGHRVDLVKGTPLRELMGRDSIMTNSLHHQGIKDLGKGVVPMGYSEDGLVECWYLDDDTQYFRAYQWHPEMIKPSSERTKLMALDFLNECLKRSDGR